MKISTEIQSATRLVGKEKAVELVAKAGFDAWDFSMFEMRDDRWSEDNLLLSAEYLSVARKLKQIGLDHGITCNQSHAPFPSNSPHVRPYLQRAIECTAEAGGEICVIHPDNSASPEKNAELYVELLPFAKDCGVKIATENMWNWDDKLDQSSFAACMTPESFCAHLDAVNDDAFVACLDIGHAEMRGSNTSAVEMIHALGPKLQALHIHDNDQWKDRHEIPFSMQIDFAAVIRALKAIGYTGYLTLEADAYLHKYSSENAFEGVCNLAEAAKHLQRLWNEGE